MERIGARAFSEVCRFDCGRYVSGILVSVQNEFSLKDVCSKLCDSLAFLNRRRELLRESYHWAVIESSDDREKESLSLLYQITDQKFSTGVENAQLAFVRKIVDFCLKENNGVLPSRFFCYTESERKKILIDLWEKSNRLPVYNNCSDCDPSSFAYRVKSFMYWLKMASGVSR